jgi:hypothetical protein
MKIIGKMTVTGLVKVRRLVGYENLKRLWVEYDSKVWEQLQ